MSAVDFITVVQSPTRLLAKRVLADGTIVPYDNVKTVNLIKRPLSNRAGLGLILTELLGRPNECVLRGGIADPERTKGVRRKIKDDPETGEKATLVETPHRWILADIDGAPLPDGVDPRNLTACGELARWLMPAPFHGVSCVVVASSSHGLKSGVRVRLGFWADRFVSGPELIEWFRQEKHGADASVFNAAQLTYTAAPVFEGGRADHLPKRLVWLPGRDEVAVPSAEALTPRERAPRPLPQVGDIDARREADRRLSCALTKVAVSEEPYRHSTIINAAMSVAGLIAVGLLDRGYVEESFEAAAERAGKPEGEATEALKWALRETAGDGASEDESEGIRA